MFVKMFKLLEEVKGEGSAGAAAPAVATPEPQQETPVVESAVDWADLSSEVEEAPFDEEDSGEQPPSEEAVQTPQPEEVQQPDTPAAEQEQPVQPEQVAPVQQPQYTPEQIAQAERVYTDQLASMYQFDEDTALKLQTEPEKVLPQLAARLHLDVMKTVMAQVQGMIPQAIEATTRSTQRESSAKDMFYGAWPELRQYEAQVMQVGQMFRQMNPNADAQTAVQRIGELTMAALGMQRQPQQPRQESAAPSVPYRPGGANRPAAPAKQANVWDDMISEDD